jgi:hypothetical protein
LEVPIIGATTAPARPLCQGLNLLAEGFGDFFWNISNISANLIKFQENRRVKLNKVGWLLSHRAVHSDKTEVDW